MGCRNGRIRQWFAPARWALVIAGMLGLSSSPWASAGQIAQTGSTGYIEAMSDNGDLATVDAGISIPLAGWMPIRNLRQSTANVRFSEAGGRREWTGQIVVQEGKTCRYHESIEEFDGTVHVTITVTAEADLPIEGVYYWVSVPTGDFAGGHCELSNGSVPVQAALAPADSKPAAAHVLGASANHAQLFDASGQARLSLRLSRPCAVTVQDNRFYHGESWSVFLPVHAGAMKVGQSDTLHIDLHRSFVPDTGPAHLTVKPDDVRYHFAGFGGSYVYGIESPVSQYTLTNLRVAWSRTQMSLDEWEPGNDDASPQTTNWAALESRDKPESALRREFEFARDLQHRGIPFIASVWRIPPWLSDDPSKSQYGHAQHVPPEKMPELLECIGSYLQHAKRTYGVEPQLFSFNEPDGGRCSPEEHRDFIKQCGPYLEKLGLKTRMLLADVTNPRGTDRYALPAAEDPEAMRYVGAVSFHSWGGGTPQQYQAWANLAERLHRPLLVAEVGVDASAYIGSSKPWETWPYTLNELRMYQELLLYARPQALIEWEYSGDYPVARVEGTGAEAKLIPTGRFRLLRQFSSLTPPDARALATTSDQPKVLATAFMSTDRQTLTLHIANLGAARPATLTGLPTQVRSLYARRTGETDDFTELPSIAVSQGTVQLDLAAQSLLTLTTRPGGQ